MANLDVDGSLAFWKLAAPAVLILIPIQLSVATGGAGIVGELALAPLMVLLESLLAGLELFEFLAAIVDPSMTVSGGAEIGELITRWRRYLITYPGSVVGRAAGIVTYLYLIYRFVGNSSSTET